ncbi:DNA-methyltransferase [Galbitalea soli]|uniref:Methyltransferase n=1 Tax=Galbitalea soli TaxID=1268042 RepID=A0A7C9PNT5_9MICO|nr:site-specific DNA-methyltransferase [Galbitalea soli]NEM91894.1 site-specific DNA-methyltransferase [Galbitalea soli]NYJ29269.1 site-specific DNA-methyltransferase (adenine-specific) [Galbitalea soli]
MDDRTWSPEGPDLVIHGDNLAVSRTLPDAAFRLIYLDPPFNTGRTQSLQALSTRRIPGAGAAGRTSAATAADPGAEGGGAEAAGRSRVGFKGQAYSSVKGTLYSYNDEFADYWEFLEPRLEEAWRLLDDRGTLYLHLDYREVHYAKVALDALFGRDCFLNEIIWAYDYGAKAQGRWPAKHDTILVYVKNPKTYFFDNAEVDREPYMAPGLVTPEKVARGKLPTDVWWHTIVSTNGRERTGYATQKPEGVLRRIIQASSAPGDWVLDFFAGSGTTAAVAQQLGRRYVAVDASADAVEVMRARLGEGPRHLRFPGAGEALVR